MDKTPMFSVIIPVYNVKNYIGNTVSSILQQTCEDYEIIIVDDGSTDGSYEICKTLSEANPSKIRLFHQPNAGVSNARNNGLQHAVGTYVSFVDGDDLILPNTLEQIKHIVEFHHPDLISFGFKPVEEGHIPTPASEHKTESQIISAESLIAQKLQDATIPCVANVYRRSFLEENNIHFTEDLYYVEDALFFFTCAVKTQKEIIIVHEDFYLYLTRQDSAVNSTFIPYYKFKTAHEGWLRIAELLSNQSSNVLDLLKKRLLEVRYSLLFFFIEKYVGNDEILSSDERSELRNFVKKYKRVAFEYNPNSSQSRGKRGILSSYIFSYSPPLYAIIRKYLRKQ